MALLKFNHPVIPLRDLVVFPGGVTTLFVGRARSIKALTEAMSVDKKIVLLTQSNPSEDDPKLKTLNKIGTLASILQLIKLPDGNVKVLVEGIQRIKVLGEVESSDYLKIQCEVINEEPLNTKDEANLSNFIKAKFTDYIKLTKKVAPEVLATIDALDEVSRVIDSIASHLPIQIEKAQEILDTQDVQLRADLLIGLLESQIDAIDVDRKIQIGRAHV